MSYQLSVIIPVWNCWNLTRDCLASLREHTPGKFMQVIVVDNGSEDETASELEPFAKTLFGDAFVLVRNHQNLGFGRASNQGAQVAQADLLFFLNNDTLIQRDWLAPLMKAFHNDARLGACGPLLLYPDSGAEGSFGGIQHMGITTTPIFFIGHLYLNFPADHRVVRAHRKLQAITGAAFMLPKSLFQNVGGFYEGYRNGSEDLDLCIRIRNMGKTLAVIPQSKIIHLESQTPGRKDYDQENSDLLNSRFKNYLIPDLHHHARRDGFDIALTPWLDFLISLPPEDEKDMCAEFAPRSNSSGDTNSHWKIVPGLWWEGIQKEPLWQVGYELVASFLEENQQLEMASGIRLLQCSFFPLIPNYRKLAKVAALSGNTKMVEQTMKKIEFISSQIENIDTLWDKATKLRCWAENAGEHELEKMYADWLEEAGARQKQLY